MGPNSLLLRLDRKEFSTEVPAYRRNDHGWVLVLRRIRFQGESDGIGIGLMSLGGGTVTRFEPRRCCSDRPFLNTSSGSSPASTILSVLLYVVSSNF
jgi:hypothetical protein